MHSMDDETRREVLGEALMDELKLIREYVQDVPQMKIDLAAVKNDLHNVSADVAIIKQAVTDQSKQFHDHERRLWDTESTVESHDQQLRKLRRKTA